MYLWSFLIASWEPGVFSGKAGKALLHGNTGNTLVPVNTREYREYPGIHREYREYREHREQAIQHYLVQPDPVTEEPDPAGLAGSGSYVTGSGFALSGDFSQIQAALAYYFRRSRIRRREEPDPAT